MIDKIAYSVGALMYAPGLNKKIADDVLGQVFGSKYSLALCLEDTIPEDKVEEAEDQICASLEKMNNNKKNINIPKIFIRVRRPDQVLTMYKKLGKNINLLTGFIFPKFALGNADAYIENVKSVNTHLHRKPEFRDKKIYMMPIFESDTLVNPNERVSIMQALKDKLDKASDYVLNIRVGGNDLSQCFGVRRNMNNTIYDIKPIANIFSDIITVFSRDYVVSGPVWEYFGGDDWEAAFEREIKMDLLNGFVGKTVIHPKQIHAFNRAMKVNSLDYTDASAVVNWDKDDLLVSAVHSEEERMNEYNTHIKWAKKTLVLADIYGIKKTA